MHDDIRKFSLEGDIGSDTVKTRERLIEFIESNMRDYGYVPALDNEPQFTRTFDEKTETFKFRLTVYGVAMDKEKVWGVSGVMNGKEIPRYTVPSK